MLQLVDQHHKWFTWNLANATIIYICRPYSMITNPDHSQTNLTSLEGLAKYIDPSQLTADLEGSLAYDHTIWIEMRCVSAIL